MPLRIPPLDDVLEVRGPYDIEEAQRRKDQIRELIIHLENIPENSFADFTNLEVLKIRGNLKEVGNSALSIKVCSSGSVDSEKNICSSRRGGKVCWMRSK